MQKISFEEFNALKNNGKIVVAFGSPECKDCHIAQPLLYELSQEYKDVSFYGVMVSKGDETTTTMGIRHIPTILFLDNGVEKHKRVVEPKDKATILEGVKALL